ncbi:MAG: hypothetical protein ACOC3T_00160, partial [Bacteroidota bacterium]
MSRTGSIYYFVIVLVLSALSQSLDIQAQDIDKDVHVVKPYEPSISDAFKINELPGLDDSTSIKPEANYYLVPHELSTEFTPRHINPAKMLGVPLSKLYPNFFRFGMGNYTTPMVEARVNSLRNEEYSWGAHFIHESSFGKIKKADDERVEAPYHDTRLDLFGKKMWEQNELKGSINFDRFGFNYYGYDTAVRNQLDKDVFSENYKTNNSRQHYTDLKTNFEFQSVRFQDTSSLDYQVVAGYRDFRDRFNNRANHIQVKAKAQKYIWENQIGLELGWEKFLHDYSKQDHTIVNIQPYLERYGEVWNVFAGIDFYHNKTDSNTTYHYYPTGKIELNVINYFLKPYIGVKGKYDVNSLYDVVAENPYIRPGLNVQSSEHELTFFGGAKGTLTPKLSFNVNYLYSIIDDEHFFVIDQSSVLNNQYTVVYDDVELSEYTAELTYNHNDRLEFMATGQLRNYLLYSIDYAYHVPKWQLNFAARYNIQNKIVSEFEVIGYGKRFASDNNASDPVS